MLRYLIAVFLMLHGLLHLYFVVLSQGLVKFQSAMGWSGRSWLLTDILGDAATRSLASIMFIVATVAFVSGGLGIFLQQDWWRQLTIASAAISLMTLIVFWDGQLQRLVEKGLSGSIIDIVVLVALLWINWPTMNAVGS